MGTTTETISSSPWILLYASSFLFLLSRQPIVVAYSEASFRERNIVIRTVPETRAPSTALRLASGLRCSERALAVSSVPCRDRASAPRIERCRSIRGTGPQANRRRSVCRGLYLHTVYESPG